MKEDLLKHSLVGVIEKYRKTYYSRKGISGSVCDHLHITNDFLAGRCDFFGVVLKLDTWLLYKEAIPHCTGCHKHWWRDVRAEIYSDWAEKVERLIDSPANKSLNILNPSDRKEDWRVKPKEFVKWLLDNGVQPRPELVVLLGLDSQSKAISQKSTHGNSERNAQTREQVLAAAFALLVNYPNKCESRGKISVPQIVRLMEEKSPILFQEGDLPLASRTAEDLLRKAIKTLK